MKLSHDLRFISPQFGRFAGALLLGASVASAAAQQAPEPALWVHPQFEHLSTAHGDLPAPNPGNQQTSTIVADFDCDGMNDFVISERSAAPAVVWYRRLRDGWSRHIIEAGPLRIEAGSTFHDITGDGAPDIVMGGDGGSNEVWWWENPFPNFDPNVPWKRRTIKASGGNKHHDQMFGDFDGDGRAELVFWNQRSSRLILTEIPADPRTHVGEWPQRTIYSYPPEEMQQRATFPSWRRPNEHEGLATADIDGDGLADIVGGGRWFKYQADGSLMPNIIDASYVFTRAAIGRFKPGDRPQVLLVVGDGEGPLMLYEWVDNVWRGRSLLEGLRDPHSLAVIDFDGDGHLDIFIAEMQLGQNPSPTARILYGDGKGGFTITEILNGFGLHEARVADLNGDGLPDILAKPYTWKAPRLDIFLNKGRIEPSGKSVARLPVDRWQRHLIESELPHKAVYVIAADLNGNGFKDVIAGAWWYENPGHLGGDWKRHTIGSPLENMAAVHDFDGDGHPDILGTGGKGAEASAEFVWARNDGRGNFTIHRNIPAGRGDFLQGVRVARFLKDGPLEIALSWHRANQGVQMLTVPRDAVNEPWGWRVISNFSEDEDLGAGDINGDGHSDLHLGTHWLENPGNLNDSWRVHFAGATTEGLADRIKLLDFTGNGRLDAAVGLEKGEDLLLFTAPEDPAKPWTRTVIARGVGGGFSMDAADLSGNGLPEIVLGEHRGSPVNRVLLYQNVDAGRAWRVHIVDTGEGGGIDHHDGTQLFDLDGDGDLDIVSVGWYNPKLWIYENLAVTAPPGIGKPGAGDRWHGGAQPLRPRPGDVFREYLWTHSTENAGGALRVGGRLDYGGGPLEIPHAVDLEHAIRAEIVVEKLLCHESTRGLAIAINGHGWMHLPEAPGIPAPRWETMHHIYPVVPVPLEQLRAGAGNRFQLRVGQEHPWNWPQNLIYGVHLRVYYDAAKKPHAQGRIVSPRPASALGVEVVLEASATSPNGPIQRVDFFGHHFDVNYEGDGEYVQWHHHYHRGELLGHIGSASTAPWRATWDTSWVPDQPHPFKVAARITDASGLITFIDAVDGLTFRRPGLSVELARPYDVPRRWLTRRGEHTQKFAVAGDLTRAVAAQLAFVSWSPGYMEGLYINDQKVFEREGPNYRYFMHRIPLADVSMLRAGENLLRTGKTPLHDGRMVHGTEVNWPGIMVLVQYRH